MRAASRRELAEPFYTARDGSTTTAVEEPSVADASSTAVAGGEGVASTNGMMSSSSSQQQQQTGAAAGRIMEHQRRKQRERDRGRSGSRRRGKGAWKKLLWVKQACECDPNTVPAPDHDLDLDHDLFFDLLGLYGRPHLEHTCGSLCAAHVFVRAHFRRCDHRATWIRRGMIAVRRVDFTAPFRNPRLRVSTWC